MKAHKIQSFIASQDPVSWAAKVRAYNETKNSLIFSSDGWNRPGDGIAHYRTSRGLKAWPVGSVRDQWEEEELAKSLLGL
jgi:hypothetical protein